MVIPKTVNPVRIVENYKSTSLSLTEDDIKRLVTIDKNLRLMKVSFYVHFNTDMTLCNWRASEASETLSGLTNILYIVCETSLSG